MLINQLPVFILLYLKLAMFASLSTYIRATAKQQKDWGGGAHLNQGLAGGLPARNLGLGLHCQQHSDFPVHIGNDIITQGCFSIWAKSLRKNDFYIEFLPTYQSAPASSAIQWHHFPLPGSNPHAQPQQLQEIIFAG